MKRNLKLFPVKDPIAERSARRCVGDGKLPNKYYVTVSCDWMTNKIDFDKAGISNSFDWAGNAYPHLFKEEDIKKRGDVGNTYGPFDTYDEAETYAGVIAELCVSPEHNSEVRPRCVIVEDRLTGQVLEGCFFERWKKTSYLGIELISVTVEWQWQRDIKLTEDQMYKRGVEFK